MLGKIEGRSRRGCQRMRWLDGITEAMDMNLENSVRCEGQGGLVCCGPGDRKELDMTGQLNNNNMGIRRQTALQMVLNKNYYFKPFMFAIVSK